MSKPSLHELISLEIWEYTDATFQQADTLAERIIKIVRDYHLDWEKENK